MDEDELIENLLAKLLEAHREIGRLTELNTQKDEEIQAYHANLNHTHVDRPHIKPLTRIDKELEDGITTAIRNARS